MANRKPYFGIAARWFRTLAASGLKRQEEKPFRFTDLPRELRNAIYTELVGEYQVRDSSDQEHFEEPHRYLVASAFYLPEMRLLNRQLSGEYEEEVSRHAHITLVYNLRYRPPFIGGLMGCLPPRRLLAKVHHARVQLKLFDMRSNKCMRQAEAWPP